MDVRQYESLLGKLQLELTDAKRDAERKIRRESLTKKCALITSQLHSVENIVAELERIGREPSAEANHAIVTLRKEEQEVKIELEMLDDPAFLDEPETEKSPVFYPETYVDPKMKADVVALIQEMRTAKLDGLSSDERRNIFEIWALRWRIVGEALGQQRTSVDRDMRTGFAVLCETMQMYPGDRLYIAALKKGTVADWPNELRMAKLRLQATRDRELRYGAVQEQFAQLKKLTLAPGDSEGARRFRHLVRDIGRHPSMRDDLAIFCEPYRDALGDDFAFLWKNEDDDVPAQSKERMSNRELLRRLLRRMISKTLIGGCHGPLDRVCTGFAEHDKGRAREIMNLMIRIGIVRAKRNVGEQRVAIEPAWVAACENFVAGKPFAQQAVAVWVAQDEPVAVSA